MESSIPPEYELMAWAAVAVLVVFSGIFSAAEAAIFSLGPVRLGRMEDKGQKAASVIRRLLEVPRRLIVTLILGNDTANIAAVVLVTWIIYSSRGKQAWCSWMLSPFSGPLLPSLAISLLLILIVGQTLPKVFGVFGGDLFSRVVAYPLWIFMMATYPFRVLLRGAADIILRALGAGPEWLKKESLEEDDIKELVDVGSRQGILDVTERELLVNLLQSEEIAAADIMTPRHQIVSIEAGAAAGELRALIKNENYSRIPVHEGGKDNFVGLVTEKDLLKLSLAEREGMRFALKDVMRKPLFVPESRRIRELLVDFRKRRSHLALVADEFGAVTGLVTMEDVLEELFGEVRDDGDELEFENLGGDRWLVMGGMEIPEFNTRTGARIQASGSRTLAGFILSKLGRRPGPGDEVGTGGFVFTVLEVRGIIIHRLEARRIGER